MKDLLKHHLPTLSIDNLVPLCKGLSMNQENAGPSQTRQNRAVRAHIALDSQLASLELIKHAAWKPTQSTLQGKDPSFD
ncbi:hypothetical protein DSO57_1034953 [Entomophthora muscae]|uniref:Uncharacterized protein n=1 Tax=Entomophthora muscae TaxID=34485 RepID=A0ACC2RQN6_9FUNG|nr:hypothetical protein DSO57_1034953 [Entomophthora muscae]